MTWAVGLRAAILAAAVALTGCANLPFLGAKKAEAASAPGDAASAAAAHVEYKLDVQAPDPLRSLLLNYLDLARFQNAPATAGIDALEVDRLLRAAPAETRGLLETEGYFNGTVTAARAGEQDGLPLLRVVVDPGPRTLVNDFALEATGELQDAAALNQPAALAELAALRGQWSLPPGQPFRQAAWGAAKNLALAKLRADGYAAASWRTTQASVDAPANRADIALVVDSGPLYHLGALRIEGAQRYDDGAIRRLSTFSPGDPYTEKSLLDFQERLQKLGLYEGVSVELDPDPKRSAAAPVTVRVKELPRHQATIGLGYSANTGSRLSLEHTDRRVFGAPLVAKNKLTYGPSNRTWDGQLSTYPLEDLYTNLVSGSASKLLVDNQQLIGWNARVGRSQDTPRIERLYFLEVTHARLDSAAFTSQAAATSLNAQWVFRQVDNLLLPTRGFTASAQVAFGYAQGSQSVLAEPLEYGRGPFSRLFSRLTWYEPLGSNWYGSARLEVGEVFSRSAVGIPDTVLFRAGGDDSVRGYGYRTLGPSIRGVTISGRTLLTSSLEVARPISPKYPAVWWAAFIDAGNAADRWTDLKPAPGYGLGLRWRSPVGPLRVDVAYGQKVHQVRLHLSVGVAF